MPPGRFASGVPDWSYQPLLKPLTAWLPLELRRSLALRGLGLVAAMPAGPLVIDFLGHMTADPCLATSVLGRQQLSPIGLAGGLDPDGIALGAFGRFGVGFVEVGPHAPGSHGTNHLSRRRAGVLVWLRLVIQHDAEPLLEIEQLLQHRCGLDALSLAILDAEGRPVAGDPVFWRSLVGLARQHGIEAVLVDLPAGCPTTMTEAALASGVSGIVLRGNHADGDGPARIRAARQRFPRPTVIVAAIGAASPREIVESIDDGADLVAVDRGLIEAGPGLVKRGNEALAGRRCSGSHSPPMPGSALRSGWTWAALLGLGMLVAGAVVWWVGLTRVVLPYDLAFLGLSRDALSRINPRLIAFMEHDRITLAGTLLSIGVLYASLAWHGMRRGWLWSRRALLASGAVGFASLFLFLGFHYVDPLHVTLSAGLFPLFVLGVGLPTRRVVHASRDLDNDSAWRLALVGQLFLIGLGFGLVFAGLTITTVGITHVFVFSDLTFLQTTAARLSDANAHLLPLIAHDRAGFGGALASDGVAVTLISLWGFRRGERWVWWTLLVAGVVGLMCAIYAHLAVGYLEFGHLLPVFVSAVVFIAGLAFSAAFLLTRSSGELSSN